MFQINMLDCVLLVILLFFGVKGLIRGLVQEVAGLLGVAAGILLARTFGTSLAPILTQYGVSSSFSPLLSMALLFLAGVFLVGIIAHILHNLLESAFAGGIDRFLGLFAGLAKGLLFAGLIGYIAVRLVPEMTIVKQSQVLPPLMSFIQALAGSLDLNIPKL
ncbi:MAG: CvpA family protein [Mailhella sp.]|nr:CvpA family protein [Mailhella sp.]